VPPVPTGTDTLPLPVRLKRYIIWLIKKYTINKANNYMEGTKDNQTKGEVKKEESAQDAIINKAEDQGINQGSIKTENQINNEIIKTESAPVVTDDSLEKGFDSILSVDEGTKVVENSQESGKDSNLNEIKEEENKSLDKETLSSGINKKNIVIGVLVVLAIILVWMWQGNSGDNNKDVLGVQNNDTVVVSDQKEQGTVKIVEGSSSTLGIDNTTLLNANQVKITAYFGNTQKNKNMTDCSIVFPLDRAVEKKYDSEVVNTVKGLLLSLNTDEASAGFFSSVPIETTLKYVKISNGVAEVGFGVGLNKIGGSCAVSAARAQIEKTLLQFPQVKSVRICVDGNCNQDEILQP